MSIIIFFSPKWYRITENILKPDKHPANYRTKKVVSFDEAARWVCSQNYRHLYAPNCCSGRKIWVLNSSSTLQMFQTVRNKVQLLLQLQQHQLDSLNHFDSYTPTKCIVFLQQIEINLQEGNEKKRGKYREEI